MSTAEVCTEVGKFYARTLDQSKMFATVIIKTTVEPQSCPWLLLPYSLAFPGSSDGKEYAHNERDPGSIPGSGISPADENSNPLQYSCLENSMDRGTWKATVHGITNFSSS